MNCDSIPFQAVERRSVIACPARPNQPEMLMACPCPRTLPKTGFFPIMAMLTRPRVPCGLNTRRQSTTQAPRRPQIHAPQIPWEIVMDHAYQRSPLPFLYTASGGVLFLPGWAHAASDHPFLLTTSWGIAAFGGMLLLFAWNRYLKRRLNFLKKINTSLELTMTENTQTYRRSMMQITAVINAVPSPVFYKTGTESTWDATKPLPA